LPPATEPLTRKALFGWRIAENGNFLILSDLSYADIMSAQSSNEFEPVFIFDQVEKFLDFVNPSF
jgi:hypothetical protein